jgi:hypothetical protein
MKNFYLLMMCLFFGISYSQNNTSLTIKESTEYIDDVVAEEIHAVRTGSNNLTGVVRGTRRGLIFDVFDENLNKLSTNNVDTFSDESYIGDLFYNNQFLVFTVNSPNRRDRVLYCHVFNLEKNSHNRIELFQAYVENNQPIFSGANKRETNFAFSPNEKYFVIATDNIKKKVNSYTVRVFDSETMSLVYEKSYQEHEKNHFQFNDVSVEDDGTVYTLGKLYKSGKSDKRGGATNYQFILNKIQPDNDPHTLYINLEDQYINSLSISALNNELHLLGFYSERRTGLMKGGCNFIINKNNFTIASKELYELPLEVYEGIYGDRKGERRKGNSRELKNFSIDYVLNDSEGNTYLLAEEFFVRHQYVTTGNGMGYHQTTYHYNDVIVFKFNNSGKLEWGRSIHKRANSPSYNAFLKNDQLHIILNSGRRLTEKNDGRTKVSRGFLESTSLYDINISKTGDISYDKIQDNRGNTYYLPSYGSFENNRFIMTSDRKRKKQFMMLE